jgi:transcriptional regulator with XRE-family HTH domain
VAATEVLELDMEFAERLAAMRKAKGLTQQDLANAVEMSVIQMHRYESGSSQPTLDAIRKLALALSASTDELIFGKNSRGPDEELRLQFEAISRFDPKAKRFVKEVLDSLILKQEAKRWAASGDGP